MRKSKVKQPKSIIASKSILFELKSPKNNNKNAPSPALLQALSQVKDFMTDSQKALILLREGKNCFDNGDIRGALDCFNEGISYNPSVTLFNLRAACHKMMEMFSEAYFDYSFNIRIEPDNGQHYGNRGLCLARLKKMSLALEDLDLAIGYEPSATNYYARATVYGDFGKFEEALSDYTAAINNDNGTLPSDFKLKCRYRRALTLFDMQKYEEVIKDANEVLMLDANNVPARALLGRAFKVLNEYQKAEEQLNHAIILDGNQPALYTERGDIRFRTGLRNKIIEAIYDFDKAVKLLETRLSNATQPTVDSLTTPTYNKLNRSSSMLNFNRQNSLVHRSIEPDNVTHNHLHPLERRDSNASSTNSLPNLTKGPSNFGFAQLQRQDTGPMSSSFKKEVEEQLGDTLYKRAQAKLMIEADPTNIEAALSDVMKAISHYPEDDDYYLVAATCHIRLQRYLDAKQILETVLERSPDNYKALYNLAFCRRAGGSQKDAIEDLTKIISYSNQEMESFTASSISVPIHRIYEMRGTLLHEVQAHKLSLMDLGKAIAINPSQPANFFLRGDCHLKLGNYEQALMDFNSAELKGFQDYCSLSLSRGVVRRLLKDYDGALKDFQLAFDHLDPQDRIGKIRVLSFCAFCLIDISHYNDAFKTLQQAQAFNSSLYHEKLKVYQEDCKSSSPNRLQQRSEQDLLYCKRTEWILHYHMGLCLYMLKSYEEAEKVIDYCLDFSMLKYIPDDLSAGCLHFFLGQTQLFSAKFEAAKGSFDACFRTHWVDTTHHRFIVTFAKAKAMQSLRNYQESIDGFSSALLLRPNDPYCLFRRAWSYKALGEYVKAGDDFETAKAIRPNDPNFAIDYKRISKFEYMEITTEPDVIEPFVPLLPVPGLQSRI